MTVALLIIAHERVADAMAETAAALFERCPLPFSVLAVHGDCEPEAVRAAVRARIEAIDEGEGVLLLTDIYGSTPSNVASSLIDDVRVKMVSGVNLPMLVRVMNYAHLGLVELAEKAVSGGREGVFACHAQHVD